MKLSVIIPVYNGEAYLEECLQSVAAQTYRDFEAIVVNDGSSDSSLEIAKGMARRDSRFKILTTANRGVSAARNTGLDVAEGDFVTFVDADDLLYTRALEFLMRTAGMEHADVIVSTLMKGEAYEEPDYGKYYVELYTYQKAMEQALYQKRIMNSPCGVLMRREFALRERGFREGTRYEDLDAFYRFFQHASRIAYLSLPLYFYRSNEDSFIHTWSRERLDVLDVTDRMVEFFEERYPELSAAAADRRFSAHYNMLLLMYRNGVDEPEYEERCWKIIREGRRRALTDRNVRMKNKLGALLSFGGKRLIKLLS